jgi:basic membrane protein A
MYKRIFHILSLLVMVAMVMGACARAATPTVTPVPKATTAPETKEELGTDARPLINVFVPSGDTQKIVDGGNRLDALLKSKYGIVTKSSVATSYAAAIEALCAGKADIVWLATLSYVLAHDKCGAVLAVTSIRRGSPTYQGQILVRADSNINSIADLKGKKFAFTDAASTSGYLYAVGLLKKNGVEVKDLAEAVFAGSHNAAALAVYRGSVDAAATFVDVRDQEEKNFPDIKQKTKVLALTDPIPNDTITFRKDLPASIQTKFKEAILDLVKTEEGKKIVYDIYEWDGAVPGDDSLFEPVRQAAASLGIQLQNWKGVSVPYKVAVVLDTGGENDKSFNEYTLKGAQRAAQSFLVKVDYVVSQAATDYEKNIETFASEGYDLIITVGFLMGDATAKKAVEHPNIKFAIIDVDYPPERYQTDLKNVTSLMFQEDEVGYLAGVLAGCMTKTGVIGSVSGMEIPPVVRFVTGYQNGAKSVRPDIKTLNVYIPNFNDPATGKQAGQQQIAQGADVIFGVGGNTGNGGLLAAKEKGLMAIGVDVDQYFTYPEVKDALITSAAKNMDVATYNAIRDFTRGTLKPGVRMNNLANKGIGLAPYHDWENKIPQECKDKVAQAQADLIAGKITTGYKP